MVRAPAVGRALSRAMGPRQPLGSMWNILLYGRWAPGPRVRRALAAIRHVATPLVLKLEVGPHVIDWFPLRHLAHLALGLSVEPSGMDWFPLLQLAHLAHPDIPLGIP